MFTQCRTVSSPMSTTDIDLAYSNGPRPPVCYWNRPHQFPDRRRERRPGPGFSFIRFRAYCFLVLRYTVAVWYGFGLATTRSWVWIQPVAAVYQRQLSVPSLRSRLMSTSESWGVNGHTTRCTSPVSVVSRLRLVSGWGLIKRRSATPHGSWGWGKDFTFLLFYVSFC